MLCISVGLGSTVLAVQFVTLLPEQMAGMTRVSLVIETVDAWTLNIGLESIFIGSLVDALATGSAPEIALGLLQGVLVGRPSWIRITRPSTDMPQPGSPQCLRTKSTTCTRRHQGAKVNKPNSTKSSLSSIAANHGNHHTTGGSNIEVATNAVPVAFEFIKH